VPTLPRAISIARRLQNPLSELVKVDPSPSASGSTSTMWTNASCCSHWRQPWRVVSTASAPTSNTSSWMLLRYVAGITERVALNIVTYRDEHGRFRSRKELNKVPGIGAKTYEQVAGFLRIRDGELYSKAFAPSISRSTLIEVAFISSVTQPYSPTSCISYNHSTHPDNC
jgi:protein Tex